MRADTEDISAFNTTVKSGRFSSSTKVLAGPATVTLNGSIVNFFDPNGATRVITMPPAQKGRFYVLNNTGISGSLDVRTDSNVAITTLGPNESALMFSAESTWTPLHAGASAIGIFTNLLDGLVPAPHTGPSGALFLRDDGVWGPAGTTVTPDGYKFMTDGVNTSTGVGADTFRFRSSTGSIGFTVTNNQVTFGDNIDLDVLEAAVDHNALLNYSADRHIAHSAVVLTAGLAITGGGDLTASRTFDFAPSELTTATPSLNDFMVWDLAAGGPRRGLLSAFNGVLNHNTLLNYVADQHVAHSGVSVVAGTGLQGGGNITKSRVLALDIGSLGAQTPVALDELAFHSVSDGAHHKVPFTNLTGAIDHNALLNYVPLQHVNHSLVNINTSSGLQGGGDLTASRTLSLDNPTDGKLYARKNTAWNALPNITVGNVAPSSPAVNDVWIDTT
jgi:hypothetical protein